MNKIIELCKDVMSPGFRQTVDLPVYKGTLVAVRMKTLPSAPQTMVDIRDGAVLLGSMPLWMLNEFLPLNIRCDKLINPQMSFFNGGKVPRKFTVWAVYSIAE